MGTGHMTVGKKKGQILKVWEVWGEGCVCVCVLVTTEEVVMAHSMTLTLAGRPVLCSPGYSDSDQSAWSV